MTFTFSKLFLLVALIVFVLATIVGFGHPIAGWEWQGLTALGLTAWVLALLVP